MNANEIVNVLRACGYGNSVCEKCPFYIREDPNECRFNAIYESADIIEAQQQEIDLLIMEITELRESNQALKDYAENADADKDEQAAKIMRLMEALEEATEEIENIYGHDTPQTEKYRELLGGAEDDEYPCTDKNCYGRGNYHAGCTECPKHKGGAEDGK